jgi:CBS domain-containing protein
MHTQNIGMLVVGDGAAIEGVVTDRDLIVRCVGEHHQPRACQIAKHMTRTVVTATSSTDALDAARVMRRHRVRRLPVVDDGQLVGVVSFSDIARALEQSVHDVLIGMTSPVKAKAPVRIGEVSHYFTKLGVAALSIEQPIRKGDVIYISGHTTDLEQRVESLEIDHRPVEFATPGDPVAVRISGRARVGDLVFIDTEAA